MGNLKVRVLPVQTGFSRSPGGGRILEVLPFEFLDLENINIGNIIKFHQRKRWVTSKFGYFPVQTRFSRSTDSVRILKVSPLNSPTLKT